MSTWNEGFEVRKKLLSLLHELLSAARSPEEKIVYPSNLIFHHPLVLLRHRKLLRHRRFHNWPSENTTLRPKDSPRFCSRANSQRRADYLWREIPTNPRSSGSRPGYGPDPILVFSCPFFNFNFNFVLWDLICERPKHMCPNLPTSSVLENLFWFEFFF